MTDLDAIKRKLADLELKRTLADLEKRVTRLERSVEPRNAVFGTYKKLNGAVTASAGEQWCECGRDVCRAPDCPSHTPDPLGR